MKKENMKSIGGWLGGLGCLAMFLGASTDDARMEARSREDVFDPKPRELFKEDCASEKTTNTMEWTGALTALAGIALMTAAERNKSR